MAKPARSPAPHRIVPDRRILTQKQRALLVSFDDDEEAPCPESRNPVKAKPRTAGRVGGEVRQKRLSDETRLGPAELVNALNLVAAARARAEANDLVVGRGLLEELEAAGLFRPAGRGDTHPIVWLPLIHAVDTIRAAVDGRRRYGRDYGENIIDSFTESMHPLATVYEGEARAQNRPELAVAVANIREGLRLVQRFWHLPKVWLDRIGYCQTPRCETPYYLDRSARRGRRRCDRHSRP